MLPETIATFMDEPRFGTLVLASGPQPRMFRCVPLKAERGITVIVPRQARAGLEAFLEGTHRAAVVVSSLDFRAYQVKGPATLRIATEAESAAAHRVMCAIGALVEPLLGIPKANYEAVDTSDAYAVDVIAEHCFEQSPRPGAGARIGGAA